MQHALIVVGAIAVFLSAMEFLFGERFRLSFTAIVIRAERLVWWETRRPWSAVIFNPASSWVLTTIALCSAGWLPILMVVGLGNIIRQAVNDAPRGPLGASIILAVLIALALHRIVLRRFDALVAWLKERNAEVGYTLTSERSPGLFLAYFVSVVIASLIFIALLGGVVLFIAWIPGALGYDPSSEGEAVPEFVGIAIVLLLFAIVVLAGGVALFVLGLTPFAIASALLLLGWIGLRGLRFTLYRTRKFPSGAVAGVLALTAIAIWVLSAIAR